MNRSVLGRVFSVLFAFYVLAFGAFLIYSVLTFSPATALPIFRWQHSLRKAFLFFVDYLIPIHVSGVVVGFSLAGGGAAARAAGEQGRSFSRMISSTLVAFIILTVVYTVLSIGVQPMTRRSISDLEYQSRLARQFLTLADRAQKNGSFAEAQGYADLYLTIDRNNEGVLVMEQELQQKTAAQKTTAPQESPSSVKPPEGLDAGGLLAKARFYYDNKDYYSANYYAAFAAKLEPGWADAQRLAAQAMEKIVGLPDTTKDTQQAEQYRKKTEAYRILMSGDAVNAYYSFLQLSAQYPKDKDIARYLEQSRTDVQDTSYFIDEAARAIPLPGTQDILFINRADKGGLTEVVFIGKLVETIEATWALDVEAVQYRPDGSVVWHLSASYGRLDGQTLIMQGLDKANAKARYMPVYTEGTRPKAELAILTLTPSVEQMKAMSTDREGVSLIGLADLWKMRTALGKMGISGRDISMQILMDVLMPFIFLTLSFIGAAFGWGFRARYLSRPPIALFFLVPVVPLVASMASLLWIHAHRVLMGFMVLAAGLVPALIVCAAVELVVLVLSLVLLAGQSAS